MPIVFEEVTGEISHTAESQLQSGDEAPRERVQESPLEQEAKLRRQLALFEEREQRCRVD
jgi:hypothetical protein